MTKSRASDCPHFPHCAVYVTCLVQLMNQQSILIYGTAHSFVRWRFYCLNLGFSRTRHCVSLSYFLRFGAVDFSGLFLVTFSFGFFCLLVLRFFFHTIYFDHASPPWTCPRFWQFSGSILQTPLSRTCLFFTLREGFEILERKSTEVNYPLPQSFLLSLSLQHHN